MEYSKIATSGVLEKMMTSVPTSNEKFGIENLKRFILFSFEFTKEASDFLKPKSKRKGLLFEALDMVQFVDDLQTLETSFPIIMNEIQDLDKEEVNQIAVFLSLKVPNFTQKLTVEQQKQMITNIIVAAFALYEVGKDIVVLTK